MADSAAPGWYHAQGDPPGTERYWDGSAWTEGPRPVGGVPSSPPASPPASPGAPAMGSAIGNTVNDAYSTGGLPPTQDAPSSAMPTQPPAGFPGAPPSGAYMGAVPVAGMFSEESKADTALVLSILGIFCSITAPIGTYIAYKEKAAIDAGRRDPANRGKAIAALVIGGLLTALIVLTIVFIALVAIFAA